MTPAPDPHPRGRCGEEHPGGQRWVQPSGPTVPPALSHSYYKGIRQMVQVSDQDMNTHLAEISRVRGAGDALRTLPGAADCTAGQVCRALGRGGQVGRHLCVTDQVLRPL